MPFRTPSFFKSLPFALSLAVVLSACSKKEKAAAENATEAQAAQPPPEVAAQIESQVVPPKNPSAATIQERLDGAVHPQFTVLLHKFVDTFGRMPESFNELAARTMDSIPALPPGLKYEIDPADKSVKVVKK
jgi:hypothetical protein